MNFHGREAVPIRSRRLPQTIETPVSFDAVPHAYVRYAYARSADSMSSGMEGQDYLCYQHNDQRLVFVVADGVGSSFCGNLAARIVGDGLLEWFWALDVAYINGPAALKEAAVSHLNKMQKMAQVEVEEYEIPDEIGGLVRTALESQRDYGSEAIFAACRIDHPNPMIPDGLLSIFWMGDTRIRAFHEEEGELDLGGARNLADRWSTKQGVRGSMSTYMRPLPGIWRVAAYSDGLSAHEEGVLDYTDMKLDSEIRAGSKLPTSDDVSFIDVVRRTAQYEGYPDLPDPNLERPTLEQIWNPQYRETFELRWNWQGETGGLLGGGKPTFLVQEANSPALTNARTFEVTETTWQPPELRKPGHYYYRVRAMPRRGPVSPWSELRQTKVAYPPPPAPDLSVDADRVLTWTEEGEQLDYVLERASDPDFAEVDRVYEGRATHWPITLGAAPPGVYHFRVQAISDGGPGPYSAPVEVSVTPPAPPRPQLGSLSHDAARGVYRLRWQATAGSTFYEIEEREEQRGETRILTTEDTTLPIDPNEKDMGEYTYRVRACHDWDCSDWSNEQTLRITPPAPAAAPTLSTSGPDEDGRIRLTWSEVPRAVDYMVETSESEDFHDARMYLQAEREIAIARREPGVVHLRVCGTNAGGDGPWSAVERIAIAPGTPPWIEITPGEEAIDVAWGAVGGRVRYTLEAAADDGSASEVYRGDETHAAVRPPQGGRIVFRVRAEVPGVASGWQTSDPITVRGGPPGPDLLPPAFDERDAVRLQWAAVPEADAYVVEVARDELFTVMARRMRVEGTQAVFQPPAAGGYWFRVRALDGDMPGTPGADRHISAERPAAPTMWPIDPVPEGQIFEIAWAGIPGCDHYQFQISVVRHFPQLKDKTKTLKAVHPSQKIAIPGASRGRYFARVRTVDASGTTSLWSDMLVIDVV